MEAEERLRLEKEPGGTVKVDNGTTQGNGDSAADAEAHDDSPDEEDHDAENSLKRKRTPPPDGLSRSAYKKLKREQKWEAGKADRKAKKKEKERSKKEAKRAAIAAGEEAPPPAAKTSRHRSMQAPVAFVIDCGFDELMTENEIKSLASQITRCYSDNSRARYKAHLAVSSFNGRLRLRFDNVLEKHYAAWKGIKFYDEDFVEVAERARAKTSDQKSGGRIEGALAQGLVEEQEAPSPGKGEVIYLSSESDNTIKRLDPYCTYIIGGLVDRNRHKGLCYKRACDRGIKTARLPIGEFMEMSSRYVLTTNHVSEIMLHWLELGDWGEAFMKVIPRRKGGTLKGNGSKDTSDRGDEVDEEVEDEGLLTNEAEGKADDATTRTDHELEAGKDMKP
jgi:tRNA (guanine9-N1)-methyltransferase